MPSLSVMVRWDHPLTLAQARYIAEAQIQRIIDRTQRGQDAQGLPFASYAPRTRKRGTVDLTDTGDMLASLEILAFAGDNNGVTGASIGVFGATATRAEVHQHGNETTPQREWLGVTTNEQALIDLDAMRFAALNHLENKPRV